MRQLKHQAPSPSFDLSSSLRMALLRAAPEWGMRLVVWGCREHHQTKPSCRWQQPMYYE